jgi:hypothetical protein
MIAAPPLAFMWLVARAHFVCVRLCTRMLSTCEMRHSMFLSFQKQPVSVCDCVSAQILIYGAAGFAAAVEHVDASDGPH